MNRATIGWLAAFLLVEADILAASPPRQEAPPTVAQRRAEIVKMPLPAESRAEFLVQLNPTDVPTRLEAARAYLSAARDTPQNVQAAQRHLGEILKLDPNNFEGLLLAGDTAVRQGQTAVAASYYRNAVRVNPNNAGAQLRLGGALERLGDIDGADAAYGAYRQLNQLPPLPPSSGKPQ